MQTRTRYTIVLETTRETLKAYFGGDGAEVDVSHRERLSTARGKQQHIDGNCSYSGGYVGTAPTSPSA